MTSMVVLLRHIEEACNEEGSIAEEHSGRLAEVMQWHSKIRCVMDTCRCWQFSRLGIRETTVRPNTE